ncbi:MAG: hypothetical protein GY869_01530, partial [Planctomycetes bacterium]|nr:hypothetical protein [Planctomycetota bacterium]
MKRCTLFSLICLFGFLLSGFNTSQVYAQGGPPMITDDPATPDPWGWEINTAFTFEKTRSERVFETPLLDINYGFGERIQLKYEVPWVILDESHETTKNGLGNSMFGVKWRFFDQDQQGFDMSVYPQVEINNSDSSMDREIVERGAEFALPFQLQKSFGPISVNPEVGYIFREYFENEWKYG